MELFESRFKKFLNVAKVMKMVGEGAEEMEYESAITFKQAKELGLLPIDGRKTTTKVKEKYMDYFTITKPNEDGFSKVIYWIKKEDAINSGDSFSLDDDIDSSLYS